MIVGFITGCVSAYGFAFISTFMKEHLKLHDTCGVINLHGIPGVMGGLISAIVAVRAGDTFGDSLNPTYPFTTGRTPQVQAGYQLAGLCIALGIAITTGLFTGFITSQSFFQPPPEENLFDDKHHWANCVIEHEELHELKKQMEAA